MECFVRVKPEKGGCWMFLTPKGGETRSWLHASLVTHEQALRAVVDLREHNRGFLFRVVSADRAGSTRYPRWKEVES